MYNSALNEIDSKFIDAILKEGSEESARFYLRKGASVHLRVSGTTPLHLALSIENVSVEFIQELLERGANTECVDLVSGETPLQEVLDEGRGDLAELLLKNYVDVDYRDEKHSTTALMSVVSSKIHNREQLVSYLIQRGADPLLINSYGSSAMSIAKARNDQVIIDILEKGR